MKTLAELYEEIIASDDLKKEFSEAGTNKEALAAFLKKNDCSATADELLEDLKARADEYKKLNEENLANVAGGKVDGWEYAKLGLVSILTLVGCSIIGIGSLIGGATEDCI